MSALPVKRELRAKFATHCKLTCLGGSENGTCACKSGSECEMRGEPGFAIARAEAAKRMMRVLRGADDAPDERE